MIHYPLEVGGILTRVLHEGSGANTAVFLHGAQSTANRWRDSLAPTASNGWTAVAPDLPGRGFAVQTHGTPLTVPSVAMFVRNFLDALEIDRAVLIGASLGAHVAAQVAIDHTARVSRLILVGPAGLSPWAFADRQQTWSSYRDANRAVIGRSIAARRGREPSWEEVEETYRMVAAPSHQEAIDSLSDYMLQGEWERDFVTDALAGVTSRVPTYILWGQDDRTFPYADGLAAHARLPGTTMATFENSGHDVDLDYPRLFHELLGRILDDDLASWQQAGVSIHTSAAPA